MDDTRHGIGLNLIGGCPCLDFANTVSWRGSDRQREGLASYTDLVAWGRQTGIVGEDRAHFLLKEAARRPAAAAAALERAIALREAIYRLFSAVAGGRAPEPADIVTLNDVLSEAVSRLRLVLDTTGFAWAWVGEGPALDQVLWPVALSAAGLLTSSELNRVGVCDGDDCGWLFFDTSKNQSRRWCDMGDCGNRAKARRHYQRRRARGGSHA